MDDVGRTQLSPGIGYQQCLSRSHFSRVPQDTLAACHGFAIEPDDNPVGRLPLIAAIPAERPSQSRMACVEPLRGRKMLAAQIERRKPWHVFLLVNWLITADPSPRHA